MIKTIKRARSRKGIRGLQSIYAVIILIVLTIAIAVVLYFQVLGKTKLHSPATLEVTAGGTGSESGNDADIVLSMQNTGDSPAYIAMITVTPDSQGATITDAAATMDVGGLQITADSNAQPPSNTLSGGNVDYPVVNGHGSWDITIHLTGSGLYPGVVIKGYVYYYDATSGKLKSAPFRATLS